MPIPEPFPSLDSSPTLTSVKSSFTPTSSGQMPPPMHRRKSSALGHLPAGDTGAPAMATSRASMIAAEREDSNDDDNAGAATPPPTSSSTGLLAAESVASTKRSLRRRRNRSFLGRIVHVMVRHTFVLPALILAIFGALYAINPSKQNPVHRFIFLSYALPADQNNPDQPTQYAKGRWDFAFVAFYTVVLSFTREFIMQELLRPLALYVGIRSRNKRARFMEQMYTAIYFGILGPVGLWVMSRSSAWYFNTNGMFEGLPHETTDGPHKFYYLFQAAYWAQQAIVLVLGMEKRRKDFKELVAHHVVTLALVWLSYTFNFTYVGIAVYVTHDISDFFLATSKSFKYVDSPMAEPTFVALIFVWIYTRHYQNIRILMASFSSTYDLVRPFVGDWPIGNTGLRFSQVIIGSLLASLQALNLFWLFFILRIAYRFLRYSTVEDDRSEAEPDEDDNDLSEQPRQEKTPLLASNTVGDGVSSGISTGSIKRGTATLRSSKVNGSS